MLSLTLRVILIVASIIAFLLLIIRIKQAKLKISNAFTWMVGAILLILMSVFYDAVQWISMKLGFYAPVNFVFLVIISFLLIETFIDNIRISQLNEKIKNLSHYIALKEHEEAKRNEKFER